MNRSVGVRELRNHLSAYLREVKAGTAFSVTASGKPVAELIPPSKSETSLEERLQQMARQGTLTLPKPGATLRSHRPIPVAPGVSASAIIIEDREDRF